MSAPHPELPIDALLPAILAALRERRSLVIEAPPGAGKTTRVPLALLDAGLAGPGREVLVLQPRRIAARMSAQRVADSVGEPVGRRVGYQVRFESATSPQTRLRFITEGLLARKLHADPELRDVGVVVLDEFHERHLDGDLGLALLRQLQRGARPDLALVVMSATLDAAPVQRYLSEGTDHECPRITSAGRMYPVTTEYLGATSEAELASAVHRAFKQLLDDGLAGDILVFLPGAREIQQAATACAGLAAHARVQIFPLHGELPPDQQDLALRPCPNRKLILSTNVAETSVTIDGVVAVIDGGLVRLPAHDPWTGIATLSVTRISRASATQRAGRAGRTRPGRCLRLYSQADHDRRPEFTPPEVARADLCAALLDLHAFAVTDPASFAWFEAPPAAALHAAEALLHRLGAVDPRGALTPLGRRILRFPVHPRLGRLLVEGHDRGVPALACGAAALLGERGIRPGNHQAHTDADADVLVDLAEIDGLRRRGPDDTPRGGLLPGPARRVAQVRDQLLRLIDRPDPDDMSEGTGPKRQVAKDMSQGPGPTSDPRPASVADRPASAAARPASPARSAARPPAPATVQAREDALRRALLAAFSDRVALARGDTHGDRVLALAGGGAARLHPASVVRSAPWLLALAVEQRQEGLRGSQILVRSACAIEPDWLLEDFTDDIVTSDELSFNPARERVEGRSELRYHGLLVEATPHRQLPPAAAAVLRDAALAAGPARFCSEPEALPELQARAAFVATHVPGFPTLGDADIRDALIALCDGRSSFAELRAADLQGTLLARIATSHNGALARFAPTHLQLPGGRRLAVHYEPGKPPWVASRLQDFFGLARGPAVADGRIPVVLHLLAPNGRAEQVTTDLAGFWDRHYPDLRRSLMRRYPRHSWPEDPRSAAPPAPRR